MHPLTHTHTHTHTHIHTHTHTHTLCVRAGFIFFDDQEVQLLADAWLACVVHVNGHPAQSDANGEVPYEAWWVAAGHAEWFASATKVMILRGCFQLSMLKALMGDLQMASALEDHQEI
jgi:hypothetical protein